MFSRERTAPIMVTAIKKEYSACEEAICDTTKQPVIDAHIPAASHELREDFFAAIAEAQIIPRPDIADQNLTANSPQPKSFSARADSHHESIVFPVNNASPILGTK